MFFKILSAFLTFFLLTACSTDDNLEINYSLRSDTKLYNEALNLLKEKEYTLAHELFNELDLQHPYSRWATKGQLMSGFALYKANKYEEAVFALSKFINLNPNNPNIAYAMYLKAYCYYERISLVTRDQKVAKKAYESFIELKRKFPSSKYAKKSVQHLALLNNQLAGKEMSIGKFYQERKKFLGAILRYKTILRDYKKSSQIPEALFRIIECSLSLGIELQAVRFISVLGYNYPKSQWYIDAFTLAKKYNLDFKKTSNKIKNKSLDLKNLDLNEFDII